MIDLSKTTLGAELELADIDTTIELPDGCTYCDKDGSICNSNGTANDPKKTLNRFGSEIQTRPAQTAHGLLNLVQEIYYKLGVSQKSCNFSTNLHVHIRVPGLKDDLLALKRIADYTQRYGKEFFNTIAPVPKPNRVDFPCSESFEGAWKRYKRRQRSHQYVVPQTVFKRMMEANTPKEFYEAHAAKDKNGNCLWHLVVRAGVNLKQVFEDTETIEFRHFTMSTDLGHMLSAFFWPKIFVESALAENQPTPKEVFEKHAFLTFQGFLPYKYQMDRIFQLTNVYHNSRSVVKANYEKLIADGVLTRAELGV